MKQVEDDLHMGEFLLDSFNIRVPHIHHDGLLGFSLAFPQTIEKSTQGSGLAISADPDHASSQIVQNHGQVPMPFADRNLVECQNPKALVIGLAILPFQKELVDVLDGLPIQAQVFGYFFDGHDLAEVVDVLSQPKGDAQVRVEESQVFDDDALTSEAEDLAVLAMEPNPSRGHIQIPHRSLRPAVDVYRRLSTEVAEGWKRLSGTILIQALVACTNTD
jgi:hypothetical protein